MITNELLVGILIAAPFLGFLVNGFRYRNNNCTLAGSIATTAVGLSFASSVLLLVRLLELSPESREITVQFFNWINVGGFFVDAAFLVDPISTIMILVITGVGCLIHLFSIGYMEHDDRPAKYFSFLNLFVFSMLLLVLGDNLLVMFVGWEGVGLCSYLLIGFWFTDAQKATAGMKAFITNRIGDAGFLVGIFLLFATFGTIDFPELAARMPEAAETGWTGPITLACLFLFIGATGKSAQIPLYVWLPDAMAGPTPVSALIHAATMVTAGVYMIVRMSAVFVMAPNAMFVIATVGALTAVMAATIGMAQWDIKKVLAYSTVSQLGYMFLGVGVGAFMPAMFHLMTHAFFKGLMFLGSGSVIHAMNDEQDMRKMGGLKKYMPVTHWTFVFGWLAIIGLPPFAGFFSKDEILWYTFASPQGSKLLWFIGLVGAVLTAFYMTRLMALVFWGQSRFQKGVHPHESPLTMTGPLVTLAVLSLVGGWLGIPHVLSSIIPGHPEHVLGEWLNAFVADVHITHASKVVEASLMGISVSLVGLTTWFAFDTYLKNPGRIDSGVRQFPWVYQTVANKYWVDELYSNSIIQPVIDLSRGLWLFIDVNFVDRATYWISDFIHSAGDGLKRLQSGNMQQYALYIALGLVVTLSYVMIAG